MNYKPKPEARKCPLCKSNTQFERVLIEKPKYHLVFSKGNEPTAYHTFRHLEFCSKITCKHNANHI